MKAKNIIKTLVVAVTLGSLTTSVAQTLHSGYFLESMVQRHEMNAAFGGESNYFIIPLVGGIQAGIHTNFGLGNYVFERNGQLVTGLSSQVSAQDFLGQLPEYQRLGVTFDLPVLSFGFRAFGGFNTVVINSKSDINLSVPASLMEFVKLGNNTSNGAIYNIDNLGFQASSVVEMAFGHSRKLDALEGFSYGAKVKFLMGLVNASMQMDHIGLSLTSDRWMVTSSGDMKLSRGFYMTDGEDEPLVVDNYGIGGWGLGVDLGAVYTPAALPDLTVSLGINDIGFMKWNGMTDYTAGGTFEYEGFENIASDEAPLDEQLDVMLDEVVELFNFKEGSNVSPTYSLKTTLNIGAEYAILNRMISFGILSSTRFAGHYTYAEGMAVVNFRPLSWLHLAVNGSYSTYGAGMGALINICPNGFNLFIGCDCITPTMRYNNQMIPINPVNANVRVGIAFPFGKL